MKIFLPKFDSIFCVLCGNYINSHKPVPKKIKCFCDDSHTLFFIYRQYIDDIPRIFGGDSFDDCIIYKDDLHPDVRRYLCVIILFSMTHKKAYHNQINDDLIREIVNYL